MNGATESLHRVVGRATTLERANRPCLGCLGSAGDEKISTRAEWVARR